MDAALVRLRTLFCTPSSSSSRRFLLFLQPHGASAPTSSSSRFISHSIALLDDAKDSGKASETRNGTEAEPEADAVGQEENSSADLVEAEDNSASGELSVPAPVKVRPYAEKLREQMVQKYLANQPIPKPHRLCRSKPMEEKKKKNISDLHDLKVEYRKQVSEIRKEYARELERQKAAKATHDKKQREEILRAKEERIRLKKEKSKLRAMEVEAEKQQMQEELVCDSCLCRPY